MRQYKSACFVLILFCVSSIAISDVDPSIVLYFTFRITYKTVMCH